jgi:CheY-like chemotaxis protein
MGPRIVLIEDDDDIRESLSDFLESEGYSVKAFPNGKEALDGLSNNKEHCVILLDLMMPVMDGFQFLKARREYGDSIIKLPTYVVSAVANKDILAGQDVAGYLSKPLDIHQLLEVVGAHCLPPEAASAPETSSKEMVS